MHAPNSATLVATTMLLAGCGGGLEAPSLQGREALLSKTAIAQKCEEAAESHEKPFVVEWDATDLASFEAKATGGTIMVRYEGCKLVPLYECSGKRMFGSYGAPHFTSGTVQGFDIENEGELYAKLPLGAANLSGRVEAGEQLHLKYFVSGVATSSRDALYRKELDRHDACREATHYVWAYNLGAFEMSSKTRVAAEAEVGFGNAGIGAKGKKSESAVSSGGEIASCKTQQQSACRVPIRLALRTIKSGNHPAGPALSHGGAPPGVPAGQPGNTSAARSAQEKVNIAQSIASLIAEAAKLMQDKRDGVSCLRRLEQAVRLDPRLREASYYQNLEPRCLMLAGRCDEGSKTLRDMLAAKDTKHLKSDARLDEEVRKAANRDCPARTAESDIDFVIRAAQGQVSISPNDGSACRSHFKKIEKRMTAELLKSRQPFAGKARNDGRRALKIDTVCVAKSIGCKEGYQLFERYLKIERPNAKDYKKLAKKRWPRFAERAKLSCK